MGNHIKFILALSLVALVSCGPRSSSPANKEMAEVFEPVLSIQPEVMDLGTIKAADGEVPCTFYCTNTGDVPANIKFVSASCSCVTVFWSDEDIPVKGTIQIDASFNPAGLGGEVTRNITVWEKGNTVSGTVEIKANIIPSEEFVGGTLLCGSADASAGSVDFGYVPAGTVSTMVETLRNVSDRRLELNVQVEGSQRLHVQCPEILDPGEVAEIVLLYSMPAGVDSLGICTNTVKIVADECQAQLPVKAICVASQDDQSGTASMWTSASPVDLSKKYFELGNNGDAPLKIYKIETDNGHYIPVPEEPIGPGEKVKIKVKAASRTEEFSARIYTNDPSRPARELRFN